MSRHLHLVEDRQEDEIIRKLELAPGLVTIEGTAEDVEEPPELPPAA